MKKKFYMPLIFVNGLVDEGSVSEEGGGTGQTTTDPYACDYNEWLIRFDDEENHAGSDAPSEYEDYVWWCEQYGFTPSPRP